MPSQTIRIERKTHQRLRELAATQRQSMQAVLNNAIEAYRRKCFLEQVNAGFAALRKNPKAWKQELEERAIWDQASADGLEDD